MKTKICPHWLQVTAALILIAALAAPAGIARADSTLTILPENIPAGTLGAAYSQQFTASGGTEPYTFTLTGTLPNGLTFSGDTLSGTPLQTGSFPITVQAQDSLGATGSRDYTLVIAKAIPVVTVTSDPNPSTYLTSTTWFEATVTGVAGVEAPSGEVTFWFDGAPSQDINCINQPVGNNSPAWCRNDSLAIGNHTVKVYFVPSAWRPEYTDASGEASHTVVGRRFPIAGWVFNDLNQNGVWDTSTEPQLEGWTVNLDEGCDGTVDQTTTSATIQSYNYIFNNLLEGLCYRVSEVVPDGWRQTTTLTDINLAGYTYDINIGNFKLPAADLLVLNLTDKSDPVKPGARLVYTLDVFTYGPDTAQNVSVVDILDPNTTFVSVSGPRGWSCAFDTGRYAVVCTRSAYAPGPLASFKITVTVNKATPNGTTLTNQAQVTSDTFDPDLANNSDTETTAVKGK